MVKTKAGGQDALSKKETEASKHLKTATPKKAGDNKPLLGAKDAKSKQA